MIPQSLLMGKECLLPRLPRTMEADPPRRCPCSLEQRDRLMRLQPFLRADFPTRFGSPHHFCPGGHGVQNLVRCMPTTLTRGIHHWSHKSSRLLRIACVRRLGGFHNRFVQPPQEEENLFVASFPGMSSSLLDSVSVFDCIGTHLIPSTYLSLRIYVSIPPAEQEYLFDLLHRVVNDRVSCPEIAPDRSPPFGPRQHHFELDRTRGHRQKISLIKSRIP